MTGPREKLTILGIYPFWTFWSMGEGKGTPSFFLSPKGFVDAGHRMVLVMPRRDNPAGESTYHGIELVRYRGAPGSILENPGRGRFIRFFIRNWKYVQYQVATLVAASRVARRLKPDLILSYGDYAAPIGWAVSRRLGVPNITRLFGTFLARFVGSRVKLYYHYIQVLGFIVPARYVILCDDGSEGDRVAKALGLPRDRLRYWKNGLDYTLYRPDADRRGLRRRLGLPADGEIIFTVSRMHPEKHIERILRAMPTVLERHPEARFLMVGDGPEEHALKEEARRLGVTDAVIWAGSVDREHLGDYLNAGDVFVAMSDRTNAANPLFEAMLCAHSCVVLNTGGTSRSVQDGVNGYLVPEDRPEELGPILSRVLDAPDERREAGRRAREWVLANIPSLDARQRLEVALAEETVREARAGRRAEPRAGR